jgi:enoyl-CoA hydratase/carnithine racemase
MNVGGWPDMKGQAMPLRYFSGIADTIWKPFIAVINGYALGGNLNRPLIKARRI